MRTALALCVLAAAVGCGQGAEKSAGGPSGGGGSGATSAGGSAPGGAGNTPNGGSGVTGGTGGSSVTGGSGGGSGTAGTEPGGSGGSDLGGSAGAAASGGAGAAAGGTTSGGVGGASGAGGMTAGAGGQAGAAGADGNLIGGTLATDSLAVRFANAVMARWPDPGNINGGINAFEYNRGIVLVGMQRVFEGTHDMRYLTYIRRYIDEFVDANGVVNRPTEHSFDTMQPAVLLPFLFEQTGQNKYAIAADNIRAVYDTIPKNSEGGYWHKQTYPNEMWLDSIYMGEPFLVKYGRIRSTCGAFCNDTPVTQMTLLSTHVRDATSGLLYHAWDSDRNATWANATTGRSPIIWSRALGWYAMSLVDVLAYLPSDHPGRAQLLTILSSLAQGLQATQDAGGLWHQVVDQGTKTDDFLESSGSAMFVYALKLASARGYIAASYADVAARGFTGLMGQVTMDATGPVINGAVMGMGVQNDYANYVNKMRLTNSSHGLCGILLAASAMESR